MSSQVRMWSPLFNMLTISIVAASPDEVAIPGRWKEVRGVIRYGGVRGLRRESWRRNLFVFGWSCTHNVFLPPVWPHIPQRLSWLGCQLESSRTSEDNVTVQWVKHSHLWLCNMFYPIIGSKQVWQKGVQWVNQWIKLWVEQWVKTSGSQKVQCDRKDK